MTNATHIQYRNVYSSRNDAVIVSDNGGDQIEVAIYIRPSSRFNPQTKMIKRSDVTRVIGALRGQFATQFAEMGA